MTAGIGVTSTGHCHPKVVAAVQEQAAKLTHAQMSCFYSDISLQLAERLTGIAPGMDVAFFANSGAEAVEIFQTIFATRHAARPQRTNPIGE